MRTETILFQLILLFTSAPSHAIIGDWKPFEDEQRFPLHEIEDAEDVWNGTGEYLTYLFRVKDDPGAPIVRLPAWNHREDVFLTLLDAEGRPLFDPWVISNAMLAASVHHADLNGDGRIDFLVSLHLDSIMLEGRGTRLAFVLSEEDSYTVTVMNTKNLGRDDFFDLDGNGSCYFVQTMYVYGEEEEDAEGVVPIYWVYNLFRVQGTELVLANERSTEFPKWIHEADRSPIKGPVLIDQEKKDRMWKRYEDDLFWEVEDEHRMASRRYWREVMSRLEDWRPSKAQTDMQWMWLRDELKKAYDEMYPDFALVREKSFLEGAAREKRIAEIRASLTDLKQSDPDMVQGLEGFLDLDSLSDKDLLFLHRLLAAMGN